jgi:D-alanyl-D-alanine carboxypeptidase (penicillin-binding protein 5/6)
LCCSALPRRPRLAVARIGRVGLNLRHVAALCLAVASLLAGAARAAETMDVSARQALLMDADTGTILFEKNSRAEIEPASLAKLMTAEIVFNQVKQGHLSLDQEFIISENAWRRGGAPSHGTTMFAAYHSHVSVANLLAGLIVISGNDAAIALAEGIDGSVDAFADRMTARARELGLADSVFKNASGTAAPGQHTTALDLARLARHIIVTYPRMYSLFGQKDFTWNKIRQTNRNPLLAMDIGADGLKTGYLAEAGYGIVGSAVQDGRRLIVVATGAPTAKDRAADARKLLDYGFRDFETQELFPAGAIIARASVYGGEEPEVGLRAQGPVRVVIHRGDRDRLSAKLIYEGPLQPPVAAGSKVGILRILEGDLPILDIPLYAAAAMGEGGLRRRAEDALAELAGDAVRRLLRRLPQ